jgi:hypothetical protein
MLANPNSSDDELTERGCHAGASRHDARLEPCLTVSEVAARWAHRRRITGELVDLAAHAARDAAPVLRNARRALVRASGRQAGQLRER